MLDVVILRSIIHRGSVARNCNINIRRIGRTQNIAILVQRTLPPSLGLSFRNWGSPRLLGASFARPSLGQQGTICGIPSQNKNSRNTKLTNNKWILLMLVPLYLTNRMGSRTHVYNPIMKYSDTGTICGINVYLGHVFVYMNNSFISFTVYQCLMIV